MTKEGLLGYWNFDEGHGDLIIDQSGNYNHLEIKGVTFPQWTDGKFKTALKYNDIGDHLRAKDSITLKDTTNGFTISAWIYPTKYSNHSSNQWYISSKLNYPNNGWWFYLKNNGHLNLSTCDGTVHTAESSEVIPLNQWTHVIGQSDGITNTLYINNIKSTSSPSGILKFANNDFNVSNTIGYGFSGIIDDVSLFNRILTSEEKYELIECPLSGCPEIDITPINTTPIVIIGLFTISLYLLKKHKN